VIALALKREVDKSKKGKGKQGESTTRTTEHPATSTFAQALLALPWVWHLESKSWM
jgi:hypothetical protein